LQDLRLLSFFLVLSFLFLISGPVQAEETVDRIIAVVNGEIVTLYELERREAYFFKHYEGDKDLKSDPKLKETIRKQILGSMIEDILLRQQAEAYKLKVSDAEVNTQIRQMVKEQGFTEEEFERTLKAEKMTLDDYREKIRLDILKHRLVAGMVRRKIIVTGDEIKAYYEEHKDEYAKDKQIDLQLIVLPVDVDAEGLRSRILAGELSFEEAAKEYSIGPGAESGGGIGSLNWRDLAAEWRQALDGVEAGGLSDVFELQGNRALLKVAAMTPGEVRPLEEVEEEISNILRQPRLEKRYKEFVTELQSKAVIDIRL